MDVANARARVRLAFEAPAALGCPDREAFASAVATRLGYDPFDPHAITPAEPPQDLDVRFRAEGRAVRATLRLVRARSSPSTADKTLVSETGSCADLGGAAAFTAALLVDPRAMFPGAEPGAPPPPSPAPSRETLDSSSTGTWPWYEPRSPLPRDAAQAPPAGRTPLRLRVGLGPATCLGCAPSASAGASLFVGLARGPFAIEAGARADLPTSTTSSSGREMQASLLVGELFPHGRLGPLRLGVLGSLGSLLGRSEDERRASLFAAVGVRAGLEWRVAAPVFVRAALDGSVVVGHVSVRMDGRELWSTSPVIGGASLAAGVEL